MTGNELIILGVVCILLSVATFAFLVTWLLKKKKEMKQKWEI